ncbi:MAG: alpha-amylase/4-alpha-glucanotransferase domain-containing protein [Promethearchaeota archaeon]
MDKNKINFPIVFHFHQPVDNFDFVIENIHDICYKPLLDRIINSNVKFTLHFTGSILEWLESHHPEYIEDIRSLCKKNQVELISGGYYEPILAIIPDDDKREQISLLNRKIEDTFNVIPKGFWLAERVWEPHLPKILSESNLKYIIVDDNHLKSCGFNEEDTYSYYITEEQGHTIYIFPINEQIRYLSPWQPVWKLKEYLRNVLNSDREKIILFMSDAEKMGEWGTTHELCYVKGHDGEKPYIEELFNFIENTDWINSVTLSECLNQYKPRGLVYLPSSSYDKMEEWVLPTDPRRKLESLKMKLNKGNLNIPEELELNRFIKGGFWRYFLAKYPESNNMHKKMLLTNEKISRCKEKFGENEMIKKARKELFKSQANDCYWHGQFGGIYLNFLRFGVYYHLINAENIIKDQYIANGMPLKSTIQRYPFLKNGRDQILIETASINAYIDPDDGGSLFELDFTPKAYNLLNTMTRWKEAYHVGGNDKNLVFDYWRKSAFRSGLIENDISMADLKKNNYKMIGGFFSRAYKVVELVRDNAACTTTLIREEKIHNRPVVIRKEFIVNEREKSIVVNINIETQTPGITLDEGKMLVNIPIFFNGDPKLFELNAGSRTINPLKGISLETSSFSLTDKTYGLKIIFTLSSDEKISIFSHETYSRMNTDDYQSKYQGIDIFLITPRKNMQIKMDIISG